MKEFGLIGFPLTHSFSKKYFTNKFAELQYNQYTYWNFEIESIQEITNILQSHPNLVGLNVTIPYKKSVISYLNDLSPVVKEIQACNCIKIKDGQLFGFNTDVIGFEKSFLEKKQDTHLKALILGTGGASAAVQWVLKNLKIPYIIVSRKKDSNYLLYEELTQNILNEYNIIINTSPIGTYPTIDECPLLNYDWINETHYLYDLVYNPSETLFLSHGKIKNATIKNGADMLKIQAEESWKIWDE